MTKASEAIVATTEAGANLLSGPNLRVADAEKASLSAYAAAYQAARARADRADGLCAASAPFNPGVNTSVVAVRVDFTLTGV